MSVHYLFKNTTDPKLLNVVYVEHASCSQRKHTVCYSCFCVKSVTWVIVAININSSRHWLAKHPEVVTQQRARYSLHWRKHKDSIQKIFRFKIWHIKCCTPRDMQMILFMDVLTSISRDHINILDFEWSVTVYFAIMTRWMHIIAFFFFLLCRHFYWDAPVHLRSTFN